MEQANHYARYLSLNSSGMAAEENSLCRCLDPSSFGKFCEYRYFYDATSFDQLLKKLAEKLTADGKNIGSQLHENRPCYETFQCDFGLMCLDWRHICDGKQQCMGGSDEEHCELLEFNECEDDE